MPEKSNKKTIKEESYKIYLQAKRYNRAANILFKISPTVPEVGLPALTNAGISIELYLKSILNFENGEFPNSHKLDELFKLLNPETQKMILFFFEKELEKVDWNQIVQIEKESNVKFSKDLIFNLRELSRTIVDLRYFFDMDYSKGLTWVHINEIKNSITKVADKYFIKEK